MNGNENTSEKYDDITEYILKQIDGNIDEADKVAVRSLIGTCMEFDNTDMSKTAMIFPVLGKKGKALSINAARFNLGLAFNIILLDPSGIQKDKKGIILFVAKLIKLAYTSQLCKILDEEIVEVLKTIYSLSYDNHGAAREKIYEELEGTFNDKGRLKNILDALEQAKCIVLIDGKYVIAEKIVFSI